VLVDKNLRFHEHVQSVVVTISRRMYNVKNFVYLSSKLLPNTLFKSFIMTHIVYLLFLLVYVPVIKRLSKIFSKIAQNLGLSI